MISPARYDITIHQGATFLETIQFLHSDNTPVDMQGYSLAGKLFNRLATVELGSFSFTWVDQTIGKFQMKLAASVTAAMSERGQYDLLVTQPNGDKFYLLEGEALFNAGLSG